MGSEISDALRTSLTELGHELADDVKQLTLQIRGVTDQAAKVMDKHVIRIGKDKQKGSPQKHLVACLHCPWSSQSSGLNRALEHGRV